MKNRLILWVLIDLYKWSLAFFSLDLEVLSSTIPQWNCVYVPSHLICFVTGSLDAAQSSKKRSSSKVVVFVLLLCVVLTTFAFLASVACCFYRRDKCTVHPPIFSSDKETSCNSGTDLISHRSSSMLETKLYINSPINHGIGNYSKELQQSVLSKPYIARSVLSTNL